MMGLFINPMACLIHVFVVYCLVEFMSSSPNLSGYSK